LTLDPGAELRQLLTSVRETLAADTAVMLLVDATGAVLEPFASSGLDACRSARASPVPSPTRADRWCSTTSTPAR
jgi:hypothetical protein